ncbi:SgcJ/EcaC family oxidoreductase [Isoptericola croceus]|uniref:SgcJ/EcaC family oxidoreductase n=1 Tax=Isoptericola croceus TaxID=3031406 RepID=UPI0023F781ED|nr:SgcJ/EcaC family oxidoreductase [Isoptericola croceus]
MTTQTATIDVTHDDAPDPGTSRPSGRRRRWWRVAVGAAVILAMATAGCLTYLRATSAVAANGVARCADVPVSGVSAPGAVAGVCDVVDGLEASWAAHDASAYGSAFTPDATYTTFAGTHYAGRQDIIDSHAALFDDVLNGTRLDNSYLALRFLTSDVAVLTVRGDTYEGDTPGTSTKVQTYTLVRADGGDQGWSVAAFQNTQRKPIMERIQFLWMPGTVPAAER